jgi:hypothetical protein
MCASILWASVLSYIVASGRGPGCALRKESPTTCDMGHAIVTPYQGAGQVRDCPGSPGEELENRDGEIEIFSVGYLGLGVGALDGVWLVSVVRALFGWIARAVGVFGVMRWQTTGMVVLRSYLWRFGG